MTVTQDFKLTTGEQISLAHDGTDQCVAYNWLAQCTLDELDMRDDSPDQDYSQITCLTPRADEIARALDVLDTIDRERPEYAEDAWEAFSCEATATELEKQFLGRKRRRGR